MPSVQAVYRRGVIKPLEKLDLTEGTKGIVFFLPEQGRQKRIQTLEELRGMIRVGRPVDVESMLKERGFEHAAQDLGF